MKKVDLSKYNNSFYQPGSRIKRLLWWLCSYFFVNTFFPWPVTLKLNLLRLFGAKIGSGVNIKPSVNIKYPWFLEIGDHAWIGEKVWIDNLALIHIGANACLSQGAMLLTGNHNYKKDTFDLVLGEIHLEEGVWVGAKSTVCPGVLMKSHSILAVGSVLTKNAEAYMIYQGNPSQVVRKRKIF